MNYTNIEKMMIYDEGMKLIPYKCTGNKWTIGVGRNIEDNLIPGWSLEQLQQKGITPEFAIELLHLDLKSRVNIASQFSWYRGLNEARQAVILNILYIRPSAIKEWIKYKPDLIKAIDAYQFKEAATIMKTLKIARQLRNRFNRLCYQFEKGIWCSEYLNFEVKI